MTRPRGTMKAVLLPGDRQVQVVERPIPVPGPGEVLVRTRASAICRSDMSIYVGNPIVGGAAAGQDPVIPGHEPAGDVVALGQGVAGVAVGDRITAYLAIGCGYCEYCLLGERMLCPAWSCLGFDRDGGDAEYFTLPAVNCLKLDDSVSYAAGAVMTDMIGTQYHAQKRLRVSGEATVAIVGLGPMGSAGVMVAQAHGARVIAVDPLADRRDLARALGADATVDAAGDVLAQVLELTDGRGVDVAIDCSGSPAGQNAALDIARKKGRVALVGESRSTTINPSDQLIRKTLEVIGGWYFPLWEYDEIQRFIVRRGVPVERMVTHRFGIDDAPEAFRSFDQRETEKAIFAWDAA